MRCSAMFATGASSGPLVFPSPGESEVLVKSFATPLIRATVLFGLCVALTGCSRSAPQPKDDGPLPITVSYPIEREVSDYSEFTGRTAAVDSVEVRARVFGNLDK